MNMDAITLLDCILLSEIHGQSVVINNGHITELIEETNRELNTVYPLVSE